MLLACTIIIGFRVGCIRFVGAVLDLSVRKLRWSCDCAGLVFTRHVRDLFNEGYWLAERFN